MSDLFSLKPIGFVSSPVMEPIDEGWGDNVAEIELLPEYGVGLEELEAFSHAVIVFLMHESSFDASSDLRRRPRGREDMPEVGIFAQRAKYRPNPIGITAVQVLDVSGNMLRVKGLDAIDGTPVLDIKPYVPAFDTIEGARAPEWMGRLMEGYF